MVEEMEPNIGIWLSIVSVRIFETMNQLSLIWMSDLIGRFDVQRDANGNQGQAPISRRQPQRSSLRPRHTPTIRSFLLLRVRGMSKRRVAYYYDSKHEAFCSS